MGTFSVSMLVGNLEKSSFVEAQALADTGSVHSYIPQDVLESVNVRPTERAFAFADERVVDIPFGYAVFVIEGMEVIAPVIFAEGSSPLLGGNNSGSGSFSHRFRQ